MQPLSLIYVFLFVIALLGYPIAKLIDQDGLLFFLVRNVDQSYVAVAYAWTLGSGCVLILMNVALGSHENFGEFMRRPIQRGLVDPNLLWFLTLTGSAGLNFYFFVRMGYSLPLLDLPGDVTGILLRRIEVGQRIGSALFNVNALLLGPMSVFLSLFCVDRNRRLKIVVTCTNFLVIGTFSLAKSSFIVGLIVVMLTYSFVRPLSVDKLLRFGALAIALLIPMFLVTKGNQGSDGTREAVARVAVGRVIYGQWAALPYFFEMFEKARQPISVLVPPYLTGDNIAWERDGEEVPARMVMRAVTGYRALEASGAGVAVTYFIGEAFAVAGTAGIILGCLLVCIEIWMMTFVFKYVAKTPESVFLYSWFIYKVCDGLVTGLSAFLISSFTLALFGVFLIVLFLKLNRVLQDLRAHQDLRAADPGNL